jgi:plastocyanin
MTFSVKAMPRADFDVWIAAIRSGETPAPSVPAGGEVLKLKAANTAYDKKDLTVTAGQPFTIDFANDDTISHNVAIYQGDKNLFRGALFTGPGTTKYAVDALPPGQYTFICDVHPIPAMTGTLTVK